MNKTSQRNPVERIIGIIATGLFLQSSAFAGDLQPRSVKHFTRSSAIFPKTQARTSKTLESQTSGPATQSSASAVATSGFTATWTKVNGATDYHLDVALDKAFTTYASGYKNLDVGNTNSASVSGLSPNTTYYYRTRAKVRGVMGSNSAVTAVTTSIVSTGLVINAAFDSSITSNANSAAIQATINQAIAKYEALFSDPITISILFRYAPTAPDGSALPADDLAQSASVIYTIPWADYITALRADAKTANDRTAVAGLPTTPLSTNILLSSANGRALGFYTPPALAADGSIANGNPYDGIVTVNSAAPFQFTRPTDPTEYDALRAIEHEIDEIMGLGSYLNAGASDLRPQDLFTWLAPGTRNISVTGSRFFSIDGGTTDIVGLNQDAGGDFGDWLSGICPQITPFVQNAFACPGQSSDVSAFSPEGINLDVIGYDLGGSSYNPATDSSVVEWLKADALSLTDGSLVARWTASKGFDATAPTGSRPRFSLKVKNGLPVVKFDGVSQYLATSSFNVPQPNQIFLVFQNTNTTSGLDIFAGTSTTEGQIMATIGTNWYMLAMSGGLYNAQSLGAVNANWHVLCLQYNGSASGWSFDNASLTTVKASPGTGSFTGLVIAADPADAFPTAGSYAEIIVRTGTANPTAVLDYLSAKWGLY